MQTALPAFSFLLLASLPVPGLGAQAPWTESLTLANQGYWPLRVRVLITNDSTNALAGKPVTVSLPGLAGATVASLRATRADGVELLFDVRDARGRAKRSGLLAADDQVFVPVECAPGQSTTVFVYAGNERAWPVPDYLPGGFQNGGFEWGDHAPEGWMAMLTDAQHVLTWEPTGGRRGSRGGKATVATGAPATWVQWQQAPIFIAPGQTYTLRGWVRATNVVGSAGWYVHVYDDAKELVNRTLNAGSGTYDWRQVSVTFTAPTNARTAIVGTVLHGTGEAWFDDAELVEERGQATVRVTVGQLERLELRNEAVRRFRPGPDFLNRAEVVARNFSKQPATSILVRVNLRYALARLPATLREAAVSVVAGDGREAPAVRLGRGGDLLIATELAARSEQRFHVGFHSDAKAEAGGAARATAPRRGLAELVPPRQPLGGTNYASPTLQADASAALADYQRLLASPANLVANGSFELGADTPEHFVRPQAGAASPLTASFSADAKFGRRSLELRVPANPRKDWLGWRSRPIPVKPGARYLLSGWLKGLGLQSSATLHAHFHNAQGALCASGAMVSTGPGVSGDSDWVNTLGWLTAPPDAASIILHLTMNTAGTLRHDGLLLCEVVEGHTDLVASAAGSVALDAPLHVWEVNPLVKVFPDTPPQAQTRDVRVELARNEYEPFQLALRGRQGGALANVQVNVSPLTNDAGAALPPVKAERVGFVPVDHPSGYYTTDVPDWCRKVPRGSGNTDGWAGEWPDPLLPPGPFDLAANRTQPVWFTVRAPRDAAPGEYRGEVRIRAQGGVSVSLPLAVRVLPFTLPERTRLRAIFDFRRGPGGWHGPDAKAPGQREKWLRFIAEHRLNVDSIEPPPKFTYTNGQVRMDATDFDAAARLCFDELGMNVAYTPHFFYLFGWAYPPKKLFGLEPFTPEWTSALQQAYRLFRDHVRAKGWLDKFVYYISDEPHFDHPRIVEQMQKLCALLHAVDRDIPIYSSTWRHCPAWDDALDLWGVGQHGSFPVAEMERLQRAGKAFWFTCDGQQATDTPYLATERLLPYYCLKYGVLGFEFWGLSWWTYDPWKVGWHWFIRQSDDGKKHYWIRYPNGDGYLAYPGQPVGVDGPVSTIRLEQVREGLEDYEAMALLGQAVEQARKAGRPTAAGERALALAKDLVVIPNAGGTRSTEILPDPDRVPAIRRAVNAALVELGR